MMPGYVEDIPCDQSSLNKFCGFWSYVGIYHFGCCLYETVSTKCASGDDRIVCMCVYSAPRKQTLTYTFAYTCTRMSVQDNNYVNSSVETNAYSIMCLQGSEIQYLL